MDFNEFEDSPLNGAGFDSFETGARQEANQLNNPLGLSDKDMQLEYDDFPDTAKPSQDDETEEEDEAPVSKPDLTTEASSSKAGDNEEAVDEAANDAEEAPGDAQTEKTPKDVNERELFGSDSEDEGPTDRADDDGTGNADYSPTAAGPADPDSDGGSIKSDVDRNDLPMSDFDLMMEQKALERKRSYRRRKGGDVDLINDHDARITEIITDMKKAAEDDRKANQRNECAFNKLKMLPIVVNSLQKQDLQQFFLEGGILSALADWLAPLPDGNLTHLKIRESILKLLGDMQSIVPEQLKNSGIGKAVMLLYKHPKELRENRAKAGKLIQEWSRPIFGTSANYKSMTREERESRDLTLMEKRRESLQGMETPAKRRKAVAAEDGEEEEEDPNREIPRARVPQPSLKDYVIRPKSQLKEDAEASGGRRSAGPKTKNRFEKKIRDLKDQSRAAKNMGGHVSVAGSKM